MIELYLVVRFLKGRTLTDTRVSDQYSQSSRESTVYDRRQSALGLVYLRSLGGSTVMFRYYQLGGDTAAPSGLYARLCYAFLV